MGDIPLVVTTMQYQCMCGSSDRFTLRLDPKQKKLAVECVNCHDYAIFKLLELPQSVLMVDEQGGKFKQ